LKKLSKKDGHIQTKKAVFARPAFYPYTLTYVQVQIGANIYKKLPPGEANPDGVSTVCHIQIIEAFLPFFFIFAVCRPIESVVP
jgi:hypothetical protein